MNEPLDIEAIKKRNEERKCSCPGGPRWGPDGFCACNADELQQPAAADIEALLAEVERRGPLRPICPNCGGVLKDGEKHRTISNSPFMPACYVDKNAAQLSRRWNGE